MRPSDRPGVARVAKRAAPLLSRAIHRAGLGAVLSGAETFSAILQGKGAGTGWDPAGEAVAAASFISSSRPTVVDGGANNGKWTRALSAQLGRGADFVLVEPQPACLARLVDLEVPGSTVTVVDAALADEPGELELFSPGEGAGNASLFERRDTYFAHQEFSATKVRTTTLDALIAEHAPDGVDFCKLDIEGAEMTALRGATASLDRRLVRAWSFEFGSANIGSRVFFRDFWDLFTSHGYRLHRIVPGGSTVEVTSYYEDLEYFRGVTNYIAALD